MIYLKPSRFNGFTALLAAVCCASGFNPQVAQADAPYSILHSFADGSVVNDGKVPISPLFQGEDGSFYGTTVVGGASSEGTVYKLTTAGVLTVLHSFGASQGDGQLPQGSFIQAADGNFYGTTCAGGVAGDGTFYKITSNGVETVLHSFGDGTVAGDGLYPQTGIVQGADGNFYGTTGGGGSALQGTIFKITPSGAETVLHTFGDGSTANDGSIPAGLTEGSNGNLYGVTAYGGSAYKGSAYKITTSGAFSIVHSFGDGSVQNDGFNPQGTLTEGGDGNFYDTTYAGGSAGKGAIVKITPSGATTVLHSFGDGSVPDDGAFSTTGLTLASDGNFYGTTQFGGASNQGVLFDISPAGLVNVLRSFGHGSDGFQSFANVIQGADGQFYATTGHGGSAGSGAIVALDLGLLPRRFDFTGNGQYNIPWYQASTGQVRIWNMFGTQVQKFSGVVSEQTGANWKVVASADVLGTGQKDLIYWNSGSGQLTAWSLFDSNLTNGPAKVATAGASIGVESDTTWQPVAVGDVTGDGHWSLWFENTVTGGIKRWALNGSTVIDYGTVIATVAPSTGWKIVGAPDTNGDGHSDLLFENGITGQLERWLMNDTTILQQGAPFTGNSNLTWKVVGTPDINNDGHTDILWYNTVSGELAYWLMNDTTVVLHGPVFSSKPDTTWQVSGLR